MTVSKFAYIMFLALVALTFGATFMITLALSVFLCNCAMQNMTAQYQAMSA